MHRINVVQLDDGAVVAFQEYGDRTGTPVIFCHGWPSSCTMAQLTDEAARALMEGERFAVTLAAARAAWLIDYSAVAACKRPVLEALFRRFQTHELDVEGAAKSDLGQAFREFQRKGGQSLADFAVFESLHEYYRREGTGFSWRDWPASVRNPRSPKVAEFATAHHDRVEFFQYLQWEADRQLAAAAVAGCRPDCRWDSAATSPSASIPTAPRHGRTRSSSCPEHRSARPLMRSTGQGRIGARHRSTR